MTFCLMYAVLSGREIMVNSILQMIFSVGGLAGEMTKLGHLARSKNVCCETVVLCECCKLVFSDCCGLFGSHMSCCKHRRDFINFLTSYINSFLALLMSELMVVCGLKADGFIFVIFSGG